MQVYRCKACDKMWAVKVQFMLDVSGTRLSGLLPTLVVAYSLSRLCCGFMHFVANLSQGPQFILRCLT